VGNASFVRPYPKPQSVLEPASLGHFRYEMCENGVVVGAVFPDYPKGSRVVLTCHIKGPAIAGSQQLILIGTPSMPITGPTV
jgi:hypothetical protein